MLRRADAWVDWGMPWKRCGPEAPWYFSVAFPQLTRRHIQNAFIQLQTQIFCVNYSWLEAARVVAYRAKKTDHEDIPYLGVCCFHKRRQQRQKRWTDSNTHRLLAACWNVLFQMYWFHSHSSLNVPQRWFSPASADKTLWSEKVSHEFSFEESAKHVL